MPNAAMTAASARVREKKAGVTERTFARRRCVSRVSPVRLIGNNETINRVWLQQRLFDSDALSELQPRDTQPKPLRPPFLHSLRYSHFYPLRAFSFAWNPTDESFLLPDDGIIVTTSIIRHRAFMTLESWRESFSRESSLFAT